MHLQEDQHLPRPGHQVLHVHQVSPRGAVPACASEPAPPRGFGGGRLGGTAESSRRLVGSETRPSLVSHGDSTFITNNKKIVLKIITFALSNSPYRKRIDVRATAALRYGGWDPHKKNVIIVHGFNSTERKAPMTIIRDGEADRVTGASKYTIHVDEQSVVCRC